MPLSFEQAQAKYREQETIGKALADAAWERGERLTLTERRALSHNSRWGSDGYPIRKLGRKWTIEHSSMQGAGLFNTKAEAVNAWETLIEKWLRLSGLEAHEQAMRSIAPFNGPEDAGETHDTVLS